MNGQTLRAGLEELLRRHREDRTDITYAALQSLLAETADPVPFPEFRNVVDVYPVSDFTAAVSFTSCRTAGVFMREMGAAIIKRRPK